MRQMIAGKGEGQQEAHVIASTLEEAAFLSSAPLVDADQDDPKMIKEALRKEFDKEAVDHEKAVDQLQGLKRQRDETLAQLVRRIEKLTREAYPDLCVADSAEAKKTHRQRLHDAFFAAIEDAMSTKIKSDIKHRDLKITRLAEELDRLELVYKKSPLK